MGTIKIRCIWYMLVLFMSAVLQIESKTTSRSSYSYSRSSYSRTSSYSYSSGSSSSGECTMSATMCIVVPVAIIGSIVFLFVCILLSCICYHNCIAKCRRAKEAKQRNNIEKLTKEKEKQKEEATKLTRMQLEMEEIELGKMYANYQTDFSITPSNPDQPNIFIVPGATVEPSYPDVNPYSGYHNTNIIPLVYDTKCYGVTYDTPHYINVPTHAPPFHNKTPPINPVSVSLSNLSKSDSLSDNHKDSDHNRHLSSQV